MTSKVAHALGFLFFCYYKPIGCIFAVNLSHSSYCAQATFCSTYGLISYLLARNQNVVSHNYCLAVEGMVTRLLMDFNNCVNHIGHQNTQFNDKTKTFNRRCCSEL